MQLQFALRLPTDAASVPVVRTLCRQALILLNADRECVADIALAVTEACANVVTHSSSSTEFEVSVEIDNWDCTITVSDHGVGFDPSTVDPSTADPSTIDRGGRELAESGRGIELMRLLVDDLDFVPADGGTVVRLSKHLQLPRAVPAGR